MTDRGIGGAASDKGRTGSLAASGAAEHRISQTERCTVAAMYYVNTQAQSNGDHEVHKEGCTCLPSVQNRIYLGSFNSCVDAVNEARKYFTQVNGCYYCSYPCHTR